MISIYINWNEFSYNTVTCSMVIWRYLTNELATSLWAVTDQCPSAEAEQHKVTLGFSKLCFSPKLYTPYNITYICILYFMYIYIYVIFTRSLPVISPAVTRPASLKSLKAPDCRTRHADNSCISWAPQPLHLHLQVVHLPNNPEA